ncbi:ABC transporter permease [Acinetobacter sp. B10A]|uniref:ABC transporter permease n=1 Tax=Acinetobacter baretiae TaxID=2605383 RepID=UPI001B3C8CEF|nr:ABC transporter permease [Acinetobacter baretiae]MBF7685429.1 ABC transporter permease [Acinetobacter baretiae]
MRSLLLKKNVITHLQKQKNNSTPPFIFASYHFALAMIVPCLLLVLWFITSKYHWLPEQILATPQQTWHSLITLAHQDLWQQLSISLIRLAEGLALGIIGGLLLGICMGYSTSVEKYLSTTFYALAIIPTLAWIPLLIVWLGIENTLKIFIIFKATLIPICIHTQVGVRDIQIKLKEVAQTLHLSPSQILLKLILPSILPHFFTGLRLAVAAAWTTLIVVELLASSEGIGYLMVTGRQLFQMDIVFVSIVVIACVGIILDQLLAYLETRFIFWPHSTVAAHSHSSQKVFSDYLRASIIPLCLLVIWVFISNFHLITTDILPTPWSVIQALFGGFTDHSLTDALQQSMYRAMLGLLLGGSLGIVLGIVLGQFKLLERLFAPTLNTFRLIAIFAWIPLITAWFGLTDLSKIIFIALASFFPLFIATWQAMTWRPKHLIEMSAVLKLNHAQLLFKFILPSIAPAIFAGLHLALLYSWMASFGAEYLMGSGIGIGSYMMAAQQSFEMDRVFAGTFLIAMIGIFLNYIGLYLEKKCTSWRNN